MNKSLAVLVVLCLSLISSVGYAKDISGKWYGKITQGPGAYSQLYDLELDLIQKGKITGESYGYIDGIYEVRIGLSGSMKRNQIELQEYKEFIQNEKIPFLWVLCIKKLNMTYRKEGRREYLQGDWNGVGKEEGKPCIPGNIILARTKEDIQLFFAGGGFNLLPGPLFPDFTSEFNNTSVKKVSEIEVSHPKLQIRLSDHKTIDDDTVSVYLNRDALANNVRISKHPVRLDFTLNAENVNELLIFAENLGKISPNTSLLEIIDGKKIYRVKIESDKQKTAAIYLKYKPLKTK